MGTIRLMSTTLANQIAAGEVVVRPASCVKELVENSLDAGAKTITVTLREGGISEITVQDDGIGMDEADAVMAFDRHATSKVYDERDLVRIRSLGFRGEALASIAAVAKVTLTTRTRDSERAAEVTIEGGEMAPLRHVGAAPGTRIEVRDLFYNTPARLKYMRTVQTEQAKAVEVVQKAALSRPDVSFCCQTEHHVLFQTPGNGDVRTVLASLYGVGEAKQLLAIEETTPDYKVSGYIGRPTQGRGTRAHAHLFINGRPVRHIGVHQAVIQGYRNRLMVGKQPIYAISIEMDPGLVDVNVHPHKAEVRFSEEADVTRCVARAVAAALDSTLLAPTPERSTNRQKSEVQPLQLEFQNENASENPLPHGSGGSPEPRSSGTGLMQEARSFSYPSRPQSHPAASNSKYASRSRDQVAAAQEAQIVYGETNRVAASGEAPDHSVVDSTQSVRQPAAHEVRPDIRRQNWTLRPIGQALGMYVIADDGDSLYIIDQHAAHERILFESFYKRLVDRDVHAMPLLAPLQLTLSPSVFERAMANHERLSSLGFTFDHFGAYDILVRTVPDIWEGLDVDRLSQETLEQLSESRDSDAFYQNMHNVIATRACKAAVKANWHLSQEELQALCSALTKLDDPFHCPHGRPIFLRFTDKQLEKEFRRIV